MRHFAGISLDKDRNDKWIDVLKIGMFDQRDGSGPFEITLADLMNAVDTADKKFFQHGQELPIFLGHTVMDNPIARISEERHGGIDALKVEGGVLMAHAVFVDDMAEKIRQKKYTGVSSEFGSDVFSETGDSLGFGLMAVGVTNTSFLGLKPISLSTPAAQESSMTQTATEQKLMILTGANTPETACAQVENMKGEYDTLKADNERLRKEVNILNDGLDNQKALSLINKAISENKPVSGMVKGFDAEATEAVPHPALSAVKKLGGIAGAIHVFSTLTPLASRAKGADSKVSDDPAGDSMVGDDDEIDGIPQHDLTLEQARKHYCEKHDIPVETYKRQMKFFSIPENKVLVGEGYKLTEQDRPKGKE
jgi:hypothetical protein